MIQNEIYHFVAGNTKSIARLCTSGTIASCTRCTSDSAEVPEGVGCTCTSSLCNTATRNTVSGIVITMIFGLTITMITSVALM